METTPAADAGTSGPAAVLHSLRDTPVSPSVQDSLADLQGQASPGPDVAASPPSSKRPRSPPVSPASNPAPPAKLRVTPLSQGGDGNRGSKSSADGSGSSPVDLTQDDGHLADDDRGGGGSGASDVDSDASSGSHASGGSPSKKNTDAASDSDEEEDEDAAEVADDLLEAQTLQALAQSRSRRQQASSRRGPKVAGSGASPDGSDGSDSDPDPAPRSAPSVNDSGGSPTSPTSPRRQSARASPLDPMTPVAPFGRDEICIPGRAQARALGRP
ncbi:hypothetical protein PR001_g23773 [Phytophthora rubi]|uniref:Uncharacterized protein n=1 Tax=Phytophthora rubi TaxID=129364 RepID=A0A6A3J9Z6_9STRA|nr:hypothetical protein PR001_g23773 [Phytophthora rubi]KAE8991490.1 hypothetical protein PR002_g20833 [Phytophthora rubi]